MWAATSMTPWRSNPNEIFTEEDNLTRASHPPSMVQWELQNSPVPWRWEKVEFWLPGPQLHVDQKVYTFSVNSSLSLSYLVMGLRHPVLKGSLLAFPIAFPTKFCNFKVIIKLAFILVSPIKMLAPMPSTLLCA